jgi:hypothetical protein
MHTDSRLACHDDTRRCALLSSCHSVGLQLNYSLHFFIVPANQDLVRRFGWENVVDVFLKIENRTTLWEWAIRFREKAIHHVRITPSTPVVVAEASEFCVDAVGFWRR